MKITIFIEDHKARRLIYYLMVAVYNSKIMSNILENVSNNEHQNGNWSHAKFQPPPTTGLAVHREQRRGQNKGNTNIYVDFCMWTMKILDFVTQTAAKKKL